jgi:choline/glycine/proline betaine transport protein
VTGHVQRWVFWPSAIVVLGFVAVALVAPRATEAVFTGIQSVIVADFGWYYVLVAAGFVAFAVWIGFSRFGDIVLGKDDERPEFGMLSWLALLFAAGMGIGLVFYGVAEPLSHYASPRPGTTGSPQALAQAAMTVTFLHWGLHAWAIYVVVGLALAYAIHRRGRPVSIRWALEPLLGARVKGGWGNTIDVIALIGTLFGVATSLGLGVLQIGAGLEHVGIAQNTRTLQIVLIVVVTGLAIVSLVSGVGKGMKWLSNANLALAAVLLIAVLALGPTQFLLGEFVQSLGDYAQRFIGLAFDVSAYAGKTGQRWQATWTTFYWGWWMSWAPFVGIFIARISRGRTVRQFVLGVLLVPTLLTFLWFSVMGGSALYAELTGSQHLVGPGGSVNVEAVLFELLGHLPAGGALVIGAILLIGVFFITSADSGALVMAMIATGGELEPRNRLRIFFAVVTALVGTALLLTGGLTALKTAAITTALPFSVVMVLMCWSTVVAFTRERRALLRAQRSALVADLQETWEQEVVAPSERPPRTGALSRIGRRIRRRG